MPADPSLPKGAEKDAARGLAPPVDAGGYAPTAFTLDARETATDVIEDPNIPKPKSDNRKIKYEKYRNKNERPKGTKIQRDNTPKDPEDSIERRINDAYKGKK